MMSWTAAPLLCVLVLVPHAALAQTPPPCDPAVLTLQEAADRLRVDVGDVERLAEQGKLPGRRVGSAWRFNCVELMAWLKRGQEKPAAPIGEAPEEREADEVLLRAQRVLLRRGEVALDFAQFYTRSGDYRLASVSGAAALTTIEQRTLTSLLLGRLGIFNETELFASTTYNSQTVRQFLGSATLASTERRAFGDTLVGIRRTLLRERGGRPDIVIALHGQIPPSGGYYAVGGGLAVVKSVDPVVLFFSSNYFRTSSRNASALARLQPKDRVDLAMGYGLALNDTLAISMSVSGVFTGSTTLDDAKLRQPGAFSVRFGLTSWLGKGLYLEPSVSFGVSGPGHGVSFGVSMPFAW